MPPVAVATCSVVGQVLECDGSASQNAAEFLWINGNAVLNTTPNEAQTVFAFPTEQRRNIILRVTSPDGERAETTILTDIIPAGVQAVITDVNVTQEGNLIRLEAVFENNPTACCLLYTSPSPRDRG